MYLDFFKCKGLPFQPTSDPAFLYLTKGHARVKACMEACLLTNAGLVVVTREAESGKTALIRQFLSVLGEDVLLARLWQTQLDDVGLLQSSGSTHSRLRRSSSWIP